jgi:hypothetical protein
MRGLDDARVAEMVESGRFVEPGEASPHVEVQVGRAS